MTHIKFEFAFHEQNVAGIPDLPKLASVIVHVGENDKSLAESGVLSMTEEQFRSFNAAMQFSQCLPVMVGNAKSFISYASSQLDGVESVPPPDVRLSSEVELLDRLKATLAEAPDEPEYAHDPCPLVRIKPETLEDIIFKIEEFYRRDELKLKRKVEKPE